MSLMNLSHFDFICGLQHVFFLVYMIKRKTLSLVI